jgi:hypothetical protein
MDSLPVRRIEALPGATRQQAYLRIQGICCMRSERTFSESEIAEKAGFHTEEGMYHWLESWGFTREFCTPATTPTLTVVAVK